MSVDCLFSCCVDGALSATMIGHWPWFATYNFLDEKLPASKTHVEKLARSAFIGFSASVVSDTSNAVVILVVVVICLA